MLSGHKLYAPYGAGVLAGRADWLDAAHPYLAGGGATKAVTERGTEWHTGAARHEAGSPNVVGAVALAAACHTLRANAETVEAHERALGARLLDGLRSIDGVQTYSLFGEDHDRVAVATFTIDGLDSSLVSTALSAEHGIGVRDGKFCAHLCVDALLDDPYADGAARPPCAPASGWRPPPPTSSACSPPSPTSPRTARRRSTCRPPRAGSRATTRARPSPRGRGSRAALVTSGGRAVAAALRQARPLRPG